KVVKFTGDGVHAIFSAAPQAALAAVDTQHALAKESWPENVDSIKVRIGLHSGESDERDGDYFGPTLNRAARIMDTAHGGQILLSPITRQLISTNLPPKAVVKSLGEHRLKGISAPEEILQLSHVDLPDQFPPLRSLSVLKHNLPVQLTTFIGREKEIDNIQKLLQDTRLLTLLGPGGTGKSRLQLQVAEEIVQKFQDGVWLVELAPLTDPAMIPVQVAAALKLQEQPNRNILTLLTDYLRHRQALLLLDNVEHLVHESAQLVEHLLKNCPDLKILVTGREALFIGGETTVQVPSLSLPSQNGSSKYEEICAAESVKLFVNRAQAFNPEFIITRENSEAIAIVVSRLDGIPLALELAAARLRMMNVEQIADRLNDRFRLLTGGSRTSLPRQQTLEALIDWSWQLLDKNEKRLLQRLSVFSGGWSLEAAQAVTADEQMDDFSIIDNLE
ncbi:MAG: AAA family ATPase, partial [Chloroflexota bacterium]